MIEKKRVVLKLDGDLEAGVKVFLEIGIDGDRPTIEAIATLPPAKELIQSFQHWHKSYRQSLNLKSRIKAKSTVPTNVRIESLKTQCKNSATTVNQSLNQWLKTDSFRSICNICLKELKPSENIKIILRTSNQKLRKLPWHEWDLWQDYSQIEFVLSAPQSKIKKKFIRKKARILAILGNKEGINIEEDKQYLQQLCKTADLVILDEPNRQKLEQYLWDKQGWDLLFFSGHSQTEGNQGRIFLNTHENDSLTIKELKYALQTAIEKGLQVAIFNSCDGLGIAQELEQLYIPNIIVMKEPVPDKVAQGFLKSFLEEFTYGESLEKSVEIARKQLQSWEKDYPSASWLPILIQNSLVQSPSWLSLNLGEISPYRGLATFREEDAIYFFGREGFTTQLITSVNQQSLVAVIGASGSGKSSLIFAGLIPQLRKDNDCDWQIISCRPTNNPFQSLATALINYLHSPIKSIYEQNQAVTNSEQTRLTELELETHLRSDYQALRQFIEEKILIKTTLNNASVYNSLPQKVLLVVDQFEELYTLSNTEDKQLFLDSLLEVVNWSPMFTLIITLRADFYESVLSYRPLSDALQNRIHNIAPMNKEELVEVINKPAQMNQVNIEKGLSETLIDSIIHESGKLPLLEFTLTQLWEQQTEQGLTYEVYEKIGGVEKALANHAEIFYAQLTKKERERVKNIFLQLVLINLEKEFNITRRLATKDEIKEENWGLVSKLANARLVVTNRNQITGIETVEVIHEALISAWGRLHQWLLENRAFLQWKQQLRSTLQQWQNTNKDKGALLRGKSLAEAEEWLIQNPQNISEIEKQFIKASHQLRNQERRRIITWLSGGLVTACILSGAAFLQLRRATINEINALNNSAASLMNSHQQLDALVTVLKAGKKVRSSWFKLEKDTQIKVSSNIQNILNQIKEVNRLEGHTNYFSYELTLFSPDGNIIASDGNDNTVKLWDAKGKLLATLEGHSGLINHIAFSPDSKIITSASSDKTVKLWNTKGELLNTLEGHSSDVWFVVFSPDGKTIASADWDKTVKLWNIEGKLLTTLDHTAFIRHVAFSPDGKTIASSISDKTIQLWNPQGELLTTLSGHSDYISHVAFSPDGKTIFSGSEDGTVKLWNLQGELLTTLSGNIESIYKVKFSADLNNYLSYVEYEYESGSDEKILPSANWDYGVRLWNQEGKLLSTFSGHSDYVSHLEFSPDGKTMASASWDNTVKLWNKDGKLLSTFSGHSQSVNKVVFSPDGKTIASDSSDNTIRLWSTEGSLVSTLSHTNFVFHVAFSPDGKTIASASYDKTVKLWNTKGELLNTLEGHSRSVSHVAFSPDGKTIVSASQDDTVKLWNTKGELLNTLEGHSSSVSHVAFSPDGRTIASASQDGTVKLWNTKGELLSTLEGHSSGVDYLVFSPDGRTIAFTGNSINDKTVKLWNTEGELLTTLEGHSSSVYHVAFSSDGKTIASSASDSTVRLWNTEGKLLNTLEGHSHNVMYVVFSPNDKIIASASRDHTIKLWSIKGDLISTLKGHSSGVDYLAFSPDGKTIASASSDNTIKLWSIKGDLISNLEGHSGDVRHVVFSPDGKTIASASHDQTVKLWSLEIDKSLQQGCDWVRDYLTHNPNLSEEDRKICDGI